MIICICKGITEEQLQAAGQDGSVPVNEVLRKLGIAQECGICLITALEKMNCGKVAARNNKDQRQS